jgi:hypothetical protein
VRVSVPANAANATNLVIKSSLRVWPDKDR